MRYVNAAAVQMNAHVAGWDNDNRNFDGADGIPFAWDSVTTPAAMPAMRSILPADSRRSIVPHYWARCVYGIPPSGNSSPTIAVIVAGALAIVPNVPDTSSSVAGVVGANRSYVSPDDTND